MGRPQSRAIVLAALVVLSTLTAGVAAVGGAAAATSTTSSSTTSTPTSSSPPPGFVNVPDANVESDLPPSTPMGEVASRMEGRVLASSNASTLDVIVTNPGRAKQYSDGAVLGGGPIAIVLRDDVNHAGREVALPADVVRDVLGYVPDEAYGTHEDGSTWQRPTTVQGDSLVFEVPHFSTNTVTFASAVELTGSPAVNGTQYEYGLTEPSGASDVTVNMTGVTSTEWDNVTASNVGDGETMNVPVGGDEPDGGTDGSEPVVTLTGKKTYSYSTSGETHTTIDIAEDGTSVTFWAESNDGVYIIIDGEYVHSGSSGSGTVEQTETLSAGTHNIDIEPYDGGSISQSGWDGGAATEDPTLTFDTGETVSYSGVLSYGETYSEPVDLSASTSSADASLAASNQAVDVEIEMRERTQTTDPSVELNGNTETVVSGTLADGETATATLPSEWLVEGTNRVNVSVGDGSLTADAPTPSVTLTYSHDAARTFSTDYEGSKWREVYSVATNYSDAREDVSLRIPFEGNVVDVGNVVVRVDGTQQPAEDVTMTDGTLRVDVGAVPADVPVEVNATGRKVVVQNGAIDVVEPTVMGDDLATEIDVVSRSEGFAIDVSGTSDAGLVHHLTSASYTPSEFVALEPDGSQVLHLPAASAGSTATVTTAPLSITPEGGGVEAIVEDASEPRFSLRHGNYSTGADDVVVTYRAPIAGETYRLYSVTRDREVIASTADADVVEFLAPANGGIYKIEEKPESSGGAVAVSSGGDTSQGVSNLTLLTLFAGIAGSILTFAVVTRRYLGLRGRAANLVVLVGGGAVGFTGVELSTSRSILSDLIFAGGNAVGDTLGGFASSRGGSVFLALLFLGALYYTDSRVIDLPRWLELVSGGLVVIWSLTEIVPGALESGLSTVSPLLWLLLAGGGVYLLGKTLSGPSFIIRGESTAADGGESR